MPITESDAGAFLKKIEEAAAIADAVELRLEYLVPDELTELLAVLPSFLKNIDKPVILTFRPSEQGGNRDLSLSDRQRFWRELHPEIIEKIGFADFELDLVESLEGESPVPWDKVICSWHNFTETPGDRISICDRILKTQAGVLKIATRANRITDCLVIFDIIERVKPEKCVIALGMGMAGVMTRVLSLSRGALLTFGALSRGAESAPGQPTVEELRNLYRADKLTKESEIFGVIGNPIGHSRSPLMHNAALAAKNRDGVYIPFEVDDVDRFIADFVRPETRKLDWKLRGLSMTIPHKISIMKHLDFIDPTARAIGAVNTVVVEGAELHGYNTDVTGAMKPLEELIELSGSSVAVLGAGGSARAVCYGLSGRGADITVFARDLNKARALVDEFEADASPMSRFNGKYDVVINCTPIGMHGHSEGESPIPDADLSGVKLVYDLVYTPIKTGLILQAERAGCRTLGGLAMLVNQAAEQFRLWTGSEPPTDLMWDMVL